MSRPKSFVKNISVDVAKRAHNCRSTKKHRIEQGDKRLGVKEGRSMKYYCIACAKKFVDLDIARLNSVMQEM